MGYGRNRPPTCRKACCGRDASLYAKIVRGVAAPIQDRPKVAAGTTLMGLHMTKHNFLGATAFSTAAGFAIALAPVTAQAQDDPVDTPQEVAEEAAEEGSDETIVV